MIGTIRKHSAWLWWLVAGLTIISFVIFMGQGGSRYGNGSGGGLGTIYGKPVTPEQFSAAEREFLIYYWMNYHEFPDHNPNFKKLELDRGTYERLMLIAKAKQLGIYVGKDAVVAEADNFLKMLGKDGEAAPMSAFIDRILTPENLTVADFERTLANNLAIQQLARTLGLAGTLVTPQEAGELYDRVHQEVSTEAVFFSATNYFSQIAATPSAVSQFYTNHMAEYRLPDRVQVNYLAFDYSNYYAEATQRIGTTNLNNEVDSVFAQKGLEAVPGAKTPEEAKDKIREMILRQGAEEIAKDKAKDFLTTLFAMTPVDPKDLVSLAKKQGLPVQTTAPFTAADGPEDFFAPTEFAKTAFALTPDSPYSIKPIAGVDAAYVMGMDNVLPSSIQPLDTIHGRVVEDFKHYEGTLMARAACSNFYFRASIELAAGKTFAQAAVAAGNVPVALKPFSQSSADIPEADDHADVDQVKQVAFTTLVGHMSRMEPTADGAFVMFVQSMLPVDEAEKKVELPRYLAQLRRSRQNEDFNIWLMNEENRELANTPVPKEAMADKASAGSQ